MISAEDVYDIFYGVYPRELAGPGVRLDKCQRVVDRLLAAALADVPEKAGWSQERKDALRELVRRAK